MPASDEPRGRLHEPAATPRADPAPGSVAEGAGTIVARRYRLGEVIAEGGMGIVHRAWHVLLERPVAVKFLRPELAVHDEIVERFLREARACAALRSSHVVKVLDVGKDANGVPFLVMELLEGADVGRIVDTQGPMPVQRAIDFICQACLALRDAHAVGIVHRDLKPENLFLVQDDETLHGCIKLLDFGISKRSGQRDLTQLGQNVGSPQYMAPEQMLAPSEVDARADIWSLGVVLVELLTGRGVFEGLTIPGIYSLVLHGKLPLLRSLRADAPATLERVISKCLQRKPQCRYQNVQDLMEALRLVAELDQQPAAPHHVREASARDSERETTRGPVADGDAASLTEKEPGIAPAGMLRRCLVVLVVLATLALVGLTSMLAPPHSGTRKSPPSSAAEHPATALWRNSVDVRHAGHSGVSQGFEN